MVPFHGAHPIYFFWTFPEVRENVYFLAVWTTPSICKIGHKQHHSQETSLISPNLKINIIRIFSAVKGLRSVQEVEHLRDKVYLSLDEYTKITYPNEPNRFAKLLLRLPALRSIGLKCLEHLFFYKLIGENPVEKFLLEMLESHNDS